MPVAKRTDQLRKFRETLPGFSSYLYRTLTRKYGNSLTSAQDVEDLIQECFLKALQHLDTFRGTKVRELRQWLRVILLNCARETFRRTTPVPRDPVELSQERVVSRQSLLNQAIHHEEEITLEEAISSLSPQETEIVDAYLLDLPDSTLAEELSCSRTAIRQRRRRMIIHLRDKVGNLGGGGINSRSVFRGEMVQI